MTAKFQLGQLVMTRGISNWCMADPALYSEVIACVDRHQQGNWGDIGDDDKCANELAVDHGTRILSAYDFDCGKRIWVITEADRSSTCILFPDEY